VSADQPPPPPPPEAPEPAEPADDPGMPSLAPPGPYAGSAGPPESVPVPYQAQTGGALNPYAEPSRPGIHWALVLVGVPIGFVAWVIGSFLVLMVTGTMGGSSGGNVVALVLLVLLLLASVGLIVWRRTRRLAQGFVLGAAIGLVVAGGLCIPLVSTF